MHSLFESCEGRSAHLADILIVMITLATALMSFEPVRQIGVSLFASAGVAGLAVGLAARPLVSNFIAGVQIAITQPIRSHDGVFLEGEYGVVEEITTTYVIVQLWDWRRMILPLGYFIEKPFQNWTSRDLGADRRGFSIARLHRAGGEAARETNGDRACVPAMGWRRCSGQ
jgi:small-conductance mechanosensitive channel